MPSKNDYCALHECIERMAKNAKWKAVPQRIDILNIDCEGCEWQALDWMWRHEREWLARVNIIRLELHTARDFFGRASEKEAQERVANTFRLLAHHDFKV